MFASQFWPILLYFVIEFTNDLLLQRVFSNCNVHRVTLTNIKDDTMTSRQREEVSLDPLADGMRSQETGFPPFKAVTCSEACFQIIQQLAFRLALDTSQRNRKSTAIIQRTLVPCQQIQSNNYRPSVFHILNKGWKKTKDRDGLPPCALSRQHLKD